MGAYVPIVPVPQDRDIVEKNIRPLEAQLAWSGDTGLVYDGAAKNVTASVSNLVKGDQCAVTVEGGVKE